MSIPIIATVRMDILETLAVIVLVQDFDLSKLAIYHVQHVVLLIRLTVVRALLKVSEYLNKQLVDVVMDT